MCAHNQSLYFILTFRPRRNERQTKLDQCESKGKSKGKTQKRRRIYEHLSSIAQGFKSGTTINRTVER